MNKKGWGILGTGVLMLGLAGAAQATLFDRGNGMIYDSDQDLTWLQDANYAQTSGYDADGLMSWHEAMAWASGLNYGGYDDWRLPTVIDTGSAGCDWGYSGTDCGYNVDTSGSELAYMWYDILGNTPEYDVDGNGPQSGWGLTSTSADGVDFLNLQSGTYWSGTENAANIYTAWRFGTDDGRQTTSARWRELYAWAVRSGDVGGGGTVPEPGTLLLMGMGLAGLAIRRRCPQG